MAGEQHDAHVQDWHRNNLLLEIEQLRAALRNVTDHLAGVMGGPLVQGAGIEFENGVEGIPTIAAARALLKDS